MSDCLFARYQLEKHGWTEGAGLGKHESGITKPVKVALKNNKDGVGHIPGSDLTKNWWDQVYNKVASQILVKTTKDGVAVHATETKESSKNKSLLYARFVKGATLKASKGITIEEPEESSESDSEKEQIPPRLTDEEIFKICGGRTAHKAAGHGLKQNGKLQRIEEQERQYLESLNKGADVVSNFPISEPKRGKKHKRVAEEHEEQVILKEEMSSQKEELHRKKRKKEAMQVEDTIELVEPTKRKKKKKCKEERKRNKKQEEEDKKDQVIENGDFKSNKKKQKKKWKMQEEKMEAVDIEKKKHYLEEAEKEGQEVSDIEKVEKKKHYEMEECEETKQEFGELTKKKKKHRVKKEQLEEVESMGKKRRKNQHQEIEYREENPSANQTLNQTEQEGKGEEERKKKKKKKKKKKQSFIKNEESSVKERQQKGQGHGRGNNIEEEIKIESMKVDTCQKKVRFSLELVTVFTFSDEENETNAQNT